MDNPAAWTLDAGWNIAAGIATHTAGTADEVAQTFATMTGKWYRLGVKIAERRAGSIPPRSVISADVTFSDRIQAATGNDTFGILASTDVDGSVGDVIACLETTACLAQGTHDIWIEPKNADDVPESVAGRKVVGLGQMSVVDCNFTTAFSRYFGLQAND